MASSQKATCRCPSSEARLLAGSRPRGYWWASADEKGNTFPCREGSSWVTGPRFQEAGLVDDPSVWNTAQTSGGPVFFLNEAASRPSRWPPDFLCIKAAAGTALRWRCRNHPGHSASNQTSASPLPFLSSTFSWCRRARLGSSPCGASCSPATGRSSRRRSFSLKRKRCPV